MGSREVLAGLLPEWLLVTLADGDSCPKPTFQLHFSKSVAALFHFMCADCELGTYTITVFRPAVVGCCMTGLLTALPLSLSLFRAWWRPVSFLPGGWFWACAFWFFALMNLETIALYGFASSPLTQAGQLLLYYDCALTGCASLSLGFAGWADATCSSQSQSPSSHSIRYLYWTHGLFVSSLLLLPYFRSQSIALLSYGGTTVVAVLFVVHLLVVTPLRKYRTLDMPQRWLLCAVFLAALSYGSALVERPLCRAFGPHFTALPVIFGGCDLAFLALYFYCSAAQRAGERRQNPAFGKKQI
eukprot:gb/GEZN01012956.1/.p1 GENE.gb/GEZN01012956.1/~~gb/GEZN01012956.1/.p1  ORF type:complete len:326 (+),score=35.40 gb/GEZN01012956.1/:79-978(+)